MIKNVVITRIISLDVFRGIIIAVMVVVNSPGNQLSYSWLKHSAWNGCTIADLVFPFFIVLLGISSVFALTNIQTNGASNRQLFKIIIKRSVYLFSIGLLLNILPNHFDISHIRILGVLQRIAVCYFFSSLLFLTTRMIHQVAIIAVLLISYWFLMAAFDTISELSINNNLVGYFDQLILSSQHLYTPSFDPEGLLSTLPAIASALLGNIMGIILVSTRTKQQQLQWLFTAGFTLSILGLFWSPIFPINKLLWSSSYALWTSGLCFLAFASCFALIEIKHLVYWSKPFLLLGRNSMLIYVLHVFCLKLQAVILLENKEGALINFRFYVSDLLFGGFSKKNASLFYAIGYTLFWLLVLKCITIRRQRKLQNQLPSF